MAETHWDRHAREVRRYVRREPERSVLYRLVYNYRDELEQRWDDEFRPRYGFLRGEVLEAFDAYLNCGILAHGCARAVCETCQHSELIAFSCKRRCLCPSCDAKRAFLLAEHLVESVLLPHPHRHVVWTIPKRVRPYFMFDRTLLGVLYRAVWDSWQVGVKIELGDECRAGMIASLHSAGNLLNFHPHIHSLVLSGGVAEDGEFTALDRAPHAIVLQETLRDRLLELLCGHGSLPREVADNLREWENSGFNVHVGDEVSATDTDRLHFLGRYLKKCPIAVNHMELVNDDTTVRYHKSTHDESPPALKLRRTSQHKDFSPLEFLAALSVTVPGKWEQTVRYYGVYSARGRGGGRQAKTQDEAAPPIGQFDRLDEEPRPKASMTWAALLKRVFEVDPLCCPKCGTGHMKIKAFITDPKEVARITKNLGLCPWRAPPLLPKSVTSADRQTVFPDDFSQLHWP